MRGWTYVAEDPRSSTAGRASRSGAATARGPATCSAAPSRAAVHGVRLLLRDALDRLEGQPDHHARTSWTVVRRADAGLPRPRQVVPESALDRLAGAVGLAQRHRPRERGLQPAVPGQRDHAQARQRHPDAAHDAVPARASTPARGGPAAPTWSASARAGSTRPTWCATCSVLGQVQAGIPSLRVEGRRRRREWIQSRTMTALWIVLGLVVLLAVFVGGVLQPLRLAAEPGAGVLAADRRRAQAAARPDPQPRRDRQGLRDPRARGLRRRDRGPAPPPRRPVRRRPSRRSRKACSDRRWAGCSRSPRPTRTSRRAPTSSSCSAS